MTARFGGHVVCNGWLEGLQSAHGATERPATRRRMTCSYRARAIQITLDGSACILARPGLPKKNRASWLSVYLCSERR